MLRLAATTKKSLIVSSSNSKKIEVFFCPQKVEKKPSKVAQKNSNPLFFSLLPAQPKQPKQKNSCSKMWSIDQLYIELGFIPCPMSIPEARVQILQIDHAIVLKFAFFYQTIMIHIYLNSLPQSKNLFF